MCLLPEMVQMLMVSMYLKKKKIRTELMTETDILMRERGGRTKAEKEMQKA